MMITVFILSILNHVSHCGKTAADWQLQEIMKERYSKLKDLEEQHIPLTIHANLSMIAVTSQNIELFREYFPTPRDKLLRHLSFLGSVTAVVVKIAKLPRVMAVRRFYTGQPTESHNLVVFLRSLQTSRLVILVGRPDFISFVTVEDERYLTSVGSNLISAVSTEDTWVMAYLVKATSLDTRPLHADSLSSRLEGWKNLQTEGGVVTAKEFLYKLEYYLSNSAEQSYKFEVKAEAVCRSTEYHKDFGPIVMDIFIPLSYQEEECAWYGLRHLEKQAMFCGLYEGYGQLCSCHNTYFPTRQKSFVGGNFIFQDDIPIVIVTATRPNNLYRLFRNLELVFGFGETKLLVVIDGYREETILLSELFGVDVRLHQPQGEPDDNTRTNMNIGFSLWAAFDHFPKANKTILLEDDLILSFDLLSYFHQTAPLLDRDPTLSHVSAYSQNSFSGTAANPLMLLRAEMYPQYGWMTSRNWAKEAFRQWVREGKNLDWDWWLFLEGPKRGLESVVPEISRTGHAGSVGAHVAGLEQYAYFQPRLMNHPSVGEALQKIDITKVSPADRYDEWMDSEIRFAFKLRLKHNPCVADIFPNNETGSFVLFLGVPSRSDSRKAFYIMQSCLGTDPRDVKEIYNGVMRLNVSPHRGESLHEASHLPRKILYLVGCPLSKYCKYSELMKDWQIPSDGTARQVAQIANERRYGKIKKLYRFRKRRNSSDLLSQNFKQLR